MTVQAVHLEGRSSPACCRQWNTDAGQIEQVVEKFGEGRWAGRQAGRAGRQAGRQSGPPAVHSTPPDKGVKPRKAVEDCAEGAMQTR